MKKVLFIALFLVTPFLSYQSLAQTNLQICGEQSEEMFCTSTSAINFDLTDLDAFNVLLQAGCDYIDMKISLYNNNRFVDTYVCETGEFSGMSIQVYYSKLTSIVTLIMVY